MHQLTCITCWPGRRYTRTGTDQGVPCYLDNTTGHYGPLPARTINPLQRYLCPDCGYTWTLNPTDRWEQAALAVASCTLLLASPLAVAALGGGSWAGLAALVVAFGFIKLVGKLRSDVEDLLDPAEAVVQR